MGVRTITLYEDSIDGKELKPEEMNEVRLTVGRRAWNLYLSEKNLGKFYDEVTKWTANEPEQRAHEVASRNSAPKRAGRAKDHVKAVREWAHNTGHQHKGKPISERGRIPEEVYTAYETANN